MKSPEIHLIVERATVEDVLRIIELAKQEMGSIVSVAWRGGYDWDVWINDLKGAINDSILEKVHVFLDPGSKTRKIAAFTWITFELQALWVDAFVIALPFQGRGYGAFILSWLIDNLVKPNKLHSVRLGVQKNNDRALKFYEKHGFKEQSFIDTANTIVMQKDVE